MAGRDLDVDLVSLAVSNHGAPELTVAHDLAIADVVNDYRVSVGLRPLHYDERLTGIALVQVDDMAANGYFRTSTRVRFRL
jgi:uncharacterized protein YkwD